MASLDWAVSEVCWLSQDWQTEISGERESWSAFLQGVVTGYCQLQLLATSGGGRGGAASWPSQYHC